MTRTCALVLALAHLGCLAVVFTMARSGEMETAMLAAYVIFGIVILAFFPTVLAVLAAREAGRYGSSALFIVQFLLLLLAFGLAETGAYHGVGLDRVSLASLLGQVAATIVVFFGIWWYEWHGGKR